jgi:signal transduction histidine kinase
LGVQVNFETADESMRMPSPIETMFFRITQEAVSNILRHADASDVNIWLGRENDMVILEIKDNGRGFDVKEISGHAIFRKQLGLLGIQERVSLVGGDLFLESNPGSGTCLLIKVPVKGIQSGSQEQDFEFQPALQP